MATLSEVRFRQPLSILAASALRDVMQRHQSHIPQPADPERLLARQRVALGQPGPSRRQFCGNTRSAGEPLWATRVTNARYACMKLAKEPGEDFVTYAGRVNRKCAKFRLGTCKTISSSALFSYVVYNQVRTHTTVATRQDRSKPNLDDLDADRGVRYSTSSTTPR
ncbi:unnamed protein product [Toxocara canis]|uniref:FLYWCH-type domain-containing protein n=1 Tax=Toxocara canis TaxID=6265 RepID=A0A183UG03_TOXCA|nr:unnamed protein product [Toxocara canis]